MATEYEVVGACITDVPTNTANGEMRVTLYKGARISSANVPRERIDHLLDVGLIAEVGGDAQPEGTQNPPVTTPDQPDMVDGGPAKVAPPPGKKNDPPAKR